MIVYSGSNGISFFMYNAAELTLLVFPAFSSSSPFLCEVLYDIYSSLIVCLKYGKSFEKYIYIYECTKKNRVIHYTFVSRCLLLMFSWETRQICNNPSLDEIFFWFLTKNYKSVAITAEKREFRILKGIKIVPVPGTCNFDSWNK